MIKAIAKVTGRLKSYVSFLLMILVSSIDIILCSLGKLLCIAIYAMFLPWFALYYMFELLTSYIGALRISVKSNDGYFGYIVSLLFAVAEISCSRIAFVFSIAAIVLIKTEEVVR